MGVYTMNVARGRAPAADGTFEFQLEPLPLHGLLFTVRASTTAANTSATLANALSMITNITVLLSGTTLFAASLADSCALMVALIGRPPIWMSPGAADNDLSQVKVYVPFGRTWAGGKWAIPSTPAGQLRLQVTEDIAVTGLDTLNYDVDAVHNDKLVPDGFLRTTTLARTAAATGDLDIDLPVGRFLAGVGVFATTERVTEAGANGIDRLKILVDSIETRYPSIEWGNAQLAQYLSGGGLGGMDQHIHVSDVAAAYTQFQATRNPNTTRNPGWQYAFLDFDPARGGEDLLDLTQCNRSVIRATMGTAEAMRVLPVEWWPNTQNA